MTSFAPCSACKRHVATHETVCPFCAQPVAPRAQHITLVGRVSRAAVFSAALVPGLVACSKDKPSPPPAAPPAQGSDDLEKMLDQDERTVEHPNAPPPIDAGAADAAADAAIADAAVPPDAGVVIKKKKKQTQKIETVKSIDLDRIQNAKPYGAPPARRRLV